MLLSNLLIWVCKGSFNFGQFSHFENHTHRRRHFVLSSSRPRRDTSNAESSLRAFAPVRIAIKNRYPPKSKSAIFSLDAEKAFDRLEWKCMWAVLLFGFRHNFVTMIKTLYHSPLANVLTGDVISSPFTLQHGTKQGCPLSPLLLCLSLEPQAQAIRQSTASPMKIGDHNHIISLYADDIILFLDNYATSIQSVIKEFDHFSSLSGYKINWTKSALMPLNNIDANAIPVCIQAKDSFTYLGITIHKNIPKINRDNFNTMQSKIKSDTHRWRNLKTSLQGRINTVKMNVLPRLNFLFFCYHSVPLQITLETFTLWSQISFGMGDGLGSVYVHCNDPNC